ncbi:aminotransferase class I/II-fold pyridoxal phosphate-dependent enzyme [Actinacidiphila sp. ITFR-21]|uniref:aminotransferase class I/II-fold pyridoxal phosphate-dependent enzyme n=1 Tax=Actinacidiphila sp. ITFR-21 TaxID=3075199 RepID=UPI00288B014A|nr:aminotransferase class I/II-fold pyridoxal phosphate-dependent enzyme [Streptomyces sp. ITFR-21]WNI18660.1 aminotransferase class I/II-fold pyridoxal phosphate-dependent enzyme [Streptomyces sp. ITFR-21]
MKTLTDYEQMGFRTAANLADGHAYQGLTRGQETIVDRLGATWRKAEAESIPQSEHRYVERYAGLIGSASLHRAAGHLILPTASNSIDLVAAYLKLAGRRVLLTHPTFDNLALILWRRGVRPNPVAEREIADGGLLARRLADTDVLFLVNPNNPTGTSLSEDAFTAVVRACVAHGVTLVIDASFRLFYPQTWDAYRVLQDLGASYIVFEDTGKVFPTQDMKASLLTYSADHSAALQEIYNEIYLCVSRFTLMVLGDFFEEARTGGLHESVHALVATRRAQVRQALGEGLIEPAALASRISVEWLSTARTGLSDRAVVEELRALGVGVLPGRGFFWDRPDAADSSRNVRISLMKPRGEFERGLAIMADYFEGRVRR